MLKATPFIVAITAVAVGNGVAHAKAPSRADAAHSLNGDAEADLRYVRSSGSTLIEEGPVSGGGISGRMTAHLNVGATFTGSFTFFTHSGELKGRGSARPHGSGRYESFSGTDTITGGTGRYAHASGHGAMYGTFDRKTYDVTIQTRGTLHY
jgi:hypothetical protein